MQTSHCFPLDLFIGDVFRRVHQRARFERFCLLVALVFRLRAAQLLYENLTAGVRAFMAPHQRLVRLFLLS